MNIESRLHCYLLRLCIVQLNFVTMFVAVLFSTHNTHLSDKNFMTHMLYKNSYQVFVMHAFSVVTAIYVISLSNLLMAQTRMLVMTLSMCCTLLLTLDTSALLWHAFCHVTNK